MRGIQNNFTSGEISPLLYGRVDITRYKNGVASLENCLAYPHGGVYRRPGIRFVAAAKEPDVRCKLVPFRFSVSQAYNVEFGDEYARFFTQRAQLISGTPVEVVTPYQTADLDNIRYAQDKDALYLTDGAYPQQKLTRVSATAFDLSPVDFKNGPFLDENEEPSWTISASGGELVTNGTFDTDISDWSDQSVGAGSIAWNAGQYMELVKSGADKGAAAQGIATVEGVGYVLTFDVGVGDLKLRIGSTLNGQQILTDTVFSAGSQSIGFVATGTLAYIEFSNQDAGTHTLDNVSIIKPLHPGAAVLLTASQNTFEPDHVGALWKLSEPGGTSAVNDWVTGTTYGISARVQVGENVYEATTAGTSGTRPPTHTRGAFSDGGVTWTFINKGWGYVKITAYSSPTEAFAEVVTYLPVNVGTGTSFWNEGAWSGVRGYPKEVRFVDQRAVYASTDYEPQKVWNSRIGQPEDFEEGVNDDDAYSYKVAAQENNTIHWLAPITDLLIGTAGEEFRVRGPNDTAASAINPPTIKVQSTYGSRRIRPVIAYNNVMYVTRSGRRVNNAVFTFQTDSFEGEDLLLAAEHLTNDSNTVFEDLSFQQEPYPHLWAQRSDGVPCALTYMPKQEVVAWSRHPVPQTSIESISTIPSPDTTRDDVWVVGKLTVDGSDVRYVGFMDPELRTDWALTGAVGGLTITGLDHLEGKTVTIVGDGANYGTATVVSGEVTVPSSMGEITEAEVGLGWVPTIVTLEPEVQLRDGTAMARDKRWAELFVRTKNTASVTVNGTDFPARTPDDNMDEAIVRSGVRDMQCASLGYSAKGVLTITQPYPAEFIVLAITGVLNIGDE